MTAADTLDRDADLALLRDAVRGGGERAVAMREGQLNVRNKGGSPVTDADLAVDRQLKAVLTAARPDYGWLSEETADDPARLAKRRLFVVDPIDGTVAYIKRLPWFSVSAAVVEDGAVVAGCVYAPVLDQLYAATLGGGARCNGSPIQVSGRQRLDGCAIIDAHGTFKDFAWPAPWPDMTHLRRNSVALRMCLVAAGEVDAALALSQKCEWDLAAADLIAREAGAFVGDHLGRSFRYNRPAPRMPSLLCCTPALAPDILGRVAHIVLP